MNDFSYELIRSWMNRNGSVNSNKEILDWINTRNSSLNVIVKPIGFSYDGFWYYDEITGFIKNRNNSFFQLAGYQEVKDEKIIAEQPVILQYEIGYLGIICKMVNGTLNFLMQAKIEPGNSNVVQISPTLQATNSNFTRKHGGKSPNYLQYFMNSGNYTTIVDQIQSEQSSRFYRKRNRNIIILLDEDVPVLDSHKWMTLGQIKEFMKLDNLVNMDTRTVISCLPLKIPKETFKSEEIKRMVGEDAFFKSMFNLPDYDTIRQAFRRINDCRMFQDSEKRLVPLKNLKNWIMTEKEIKCLKPFPFKLIYCHIEIEGREVQCWKQPLVQALGESIFGTFTCVDKGIRKYLVRIKKEIGCFDCAELGPAVQLEPTYSEEFLDDVEKFLLVKVSNKDGVIINVVQSEEGGRFYHEENRNIIIEIDKNEIKELPEEFLWMDYATISEMIQFNNCVNIQLRNLISLIDFPK